jgi:hypothetical protein
VWDLLHAILLESRILRWFLDFLKIFACLVVVMAAVVMLLVMVVVVVVVVVVAVVHR